MVYLCPVCQDSFDLNDLTTHINEKHKNKVFISGWPCGICIEKFTTPKRLINHLSAKHATSEISVPLASQIPPSLEQNSSENNSNLLMEPPKKRFKKSLPEINYEVISKEIEKFVVSLYSNEKQCRSQALSTVKAIQTLFKCIFDLTSEGLEQFCDCYHQISCVSAAVDSIFCKYESDYKVTKQLKENTVFIPSKTVNIGSRLGSKKENGVTNLGVQDAKTESVSIKEVLTQYISVPGLYNEITLHLENCEKSTSITSPMSGSVWKSIKSSFDGKIVFPLQLYFDDFEINDVLSSRRGFAKQGAIYFSLMCIPDKYKSSLPNILLAQLHKYVDHVEFGNLAIFDNIIKELKYLEDHGLSLLINGSRKQIYFALLSITGDNLGLNTVLGFVGSSSGQDCCRFCIANIQERKKMVVVNTKLRRTVDNYSDHVKSHSFGINEECIFNRLRSYHVITNMCCDIDHDFQEGICRYVTKHCIDHFLKEKYFTLEELNHEIKYRDCTPSYGSNIISCIRESVIEKDVIKLTSSEMKTLMEYLCFYVGFKIPKKDKHWKMYLSLRCIMVIVRSSNFDDNKLNQLNKHIKSLLQLYNSICEDTIKYKIHFLLHYVDVIRALGPPKYYSTMRYEANHKVMKNIAGATKSRRNACKTIGHKNQIILLKQLSSNQHLSSRISWGPIFSHELSFSEYYDEFKHLPIVSEIEKCFMTNWVTVYGTDYEVNLSLVVDSCENVNPNFGKIIHIAIDQTSRVIFFFKFLKVVEDSYHLQGFRVEESRVWGAILQEDLFYFKPRKITKLSDGNSWIIKAI